MRHIHPKALTLLVSSYPDVKSAMDAILLEADEIIVKPFETRQLPDLVHDKLLTRQPVVPTPKERVAELLKQRTSQIVEDWLAKVKKIKELSHVSLGDEEHTGYLHKLIEDLIMRPESAHHPRRRKRIRLFRPPPSLMARCRSRKATLLRCWCRTHEHSK